jgi:hypothetical protein
MQIATILSLVGSVTCVGLFTKQKDWLLATAFIFSTAYTILDKVIHIPTVPFFVVSWLAYLFFALVAYEIFRKVFLK